MKVVTSAAAMQRFALRWRRQGMAVGFVPTMGFLHDGHLSLARRARAAIGPRGLVVLSIYVNPTQFGPREDLGRYPRDLPRDLARCRKEGVDVVFAPAAREAIYAADHSTFVVEEQLAQRMEGAARPGHFRGVATIVAKLFNLVLPDVAVFGAKDCQQAAVVRRMVRDLNFPVKIIVAPTRREPDGLALSSRNKYLDATQRRQATVLWRAIQQARQTVRAKRTGVSTARLHAELTRLIAREPAARADYIEFFDSETLQPLRTVKRGAHLAMAVFFGRTRLIDNARL